MEDETKFNCPDEKRSSKRREILDTFFVYLQVPHIGSRKILLKDICEKGLAFYSEPGLSFKKDSKMDCFFFINESIRLPISLQVLHIVTDDSGDWIGCEFTDTASQAYIAIHRFVALIDSLYSFSFSDA